MGRILTVEQAAEKLQVKPKTVRAWLKAGKIPGRKIGRVYRVLEDELEAFLAFGVSEDESLAFEPPQTMRLVPPAATERRSARGLAAGVPGSVDDFMRNKHEETAREEWRMLRPEERRRRLAAARGILADMSFTSEDFMREKREESAREARRGR